MPRIAIAQFFQETDTFNPELTTKADFAGYRLDLDPTTKPSVDPDSELAGALSLLNQHPGYELVTLFQAWGGVGGRVEDAFVREIEAKLVEGLRHLGPFDACLLLLHGACAAVSEDDVEGVLVEAARNCLPGLPIAVALDHHAKLTKRLMSNASVVVGHRTEPHKPYETASLAAALLVQLVEGQINPTLAWATVPMLTPQERFETHEGPMHELFELARGLESDPTLSVSPFPMQPWLDVAEGGWAVAVVANGNYEAARIAAERVAVAMWRSRHAFWQQMSVDAEEAVKRALALNGLGIICDMGDAVFAGGTGDGTELIAALVKRNAPSAATVRDRPAVLKAWAAGTGAEIDVSLGGEVDRLYARPLTVHATVESLSEGPIAVPGLFGLRQLDEGRTALLRVGRVFVHVTEWRGSGGCHPASFQRHGVDPGQLYALVSKGSAHHHTYKQWSAGVVRANTPGLSQSDLKKFEWRHIPRPMFGIDDVEEWNAAPGSHAPSPADPIRVFDNSGGRGARDI